MTPTLYQFTVLYLPKETKDQSGNDTTPASAIVVPPTWILAGSTNEVAIKAAKQIPDEYNNKLDQVQVLVKPF